MPSFEISLYEMMFEKWIPITKGATESHFFVIFLKLEAHRFMSLSVRLSLSTGIRVMATTPRRYGERERIKVSCFSNGRLPRGLSLLQVARQRILGSSIDYILSW